MQIEKNDKKETRRSVISPIIAALLIMLSPFACFNMPVRAADAIVEEIETALISLDEMVDYIEASAGAGVGSELIEYLTGEKGWFFDPNTGLLLNEDPSVTSDAYLNAIVPRCNSLGYFTELVSGKFDVANKIVTSVDDSLNISGEDFAAVVARLNEQYAPAATCEYISWKNNSKIIKGYPALTLYYDGNICNYTPDAAPDGVYLLPFFRVGDDYYYRFEQLHLYQQLNDDYTITLFYGALNNTEGSEVYRTFSLNGSLSQYRYVSINLRLDSYFPSFRSLENYIVGTTPDYNLQFGSGKAANTNAIVSSESFLWGKYFLSADVTQYIDLASKDSHGSFTHMAYNAPTDDCDFDFGYFLSTEPHEPLKGMYPDIITENIDPNGLVTLDGDTVYEYIITGSDGSEMIMGDYINNNYTYITNNYGDSGSGSDNSTSLPSVPNVQLDLDQYLDGVDDYVATTENFFDKMYKIIPEPIMNTIIISFGLIVVVGVIKIIFFLK